LLIIHSETYSQQAAYDVTVGSMLGLVSMLIISLIAITSLLIFFTPIREWIPGYTDPELKIRQGLLIQKMGEMEKLIAKQDSFIKSFQRLSGVSKDSTGKIIPIQDSKRSNIPVSYQKKIDEAINTTQPEIPFNFSKITAKTNVISNEVVNLIPPIDGLLTKRFDEEEGHFAIDLAAKENSLVKSVADGFVFFSEYSRETGYVIGIFHKNNLLSFYKHNNKLFKKAGSFVLAGEAIAMLGNSGIHSTGPHLHFELWLNGKPVNPLVFLTYSEK
ncbi:MAG: M23 family metallopeptidase, partial [Bacteroidia bacterium]|nr:M23 family metallopeptidase [Bacteroidia bacterium]